MHLHRSMLNAGANPIVVQKQMRRSHPSTTLGIYGHIVGNAQRRAVQSHAKPIETEVLKFELQPTPINGA